MAFTYSSNHVHQTITWEFDEFAEADVIPDFESVDMRCCMFNAPGLPTTWVISDREFIGLNHEAEVSIPL